MMPSSTLIKHNETAQNLKCFLPQISFLKFRDQMEEWSAAEANLFEEAIEKYQKDFNDIRADFVSF